jgi:hypothetical protein
MTLNLTQFPKRIFEDVYLTKIVVRKDPDNGGRSRPKHAYILIPKMMAEEQSIKDGSYLFKIKRLSDAYCEDELMLAVVTDISNPAYPFVAQLPEGNGFDDGQAVYVKAKPFDLEKWFKSRRSKGFDKLTGYEEEDA